jgi:acid phosphatase type 7
MNYRTFLILFLTLANVSTVRAQEFLWEPYLQNVTSHGCTVSWGNNIESPGTVVMVSNRERFRKRSTSSIHHEVRFSRLTPDTRYRYQVKIPGSTRRWGVCHTAPLPSDFETVRVAVVGDSGVGSSEQYQVSEAIRNFNPDLILHTGDIVYDLGEYEHYRQKFFLPYQSLLRGRPLYPSMGNHDANNPAVFEGVYQLPRKASRSETERYYSFNFGPLHFISLDTTQDFSPGSRQHEWLVSDLRRSSSSLWRVAFFHYPAYSAGPHGDTPEVKEQLVPLFEQYHVQLVLSGHDHAYERSFPLGLSRHKVLYIVTGGGGNSLYEQQTENLNIATYEARYHFTGISDFIQQNTRAGGG